MSERFERGRLLGKGTFSEVYQARDRETNMMVALKVIEKRMIAKYRIQDLVEQEIKIQSTLAHQHIVQLYGVMQDPQRVSASPAYP